MTALARYGTLADLKALRIKEYVDPTDPASYVEHSMRTLKSLAKLGRVAGSVQLEFSGFAHLISVIDWAWDEGHISNMLADDLARIVVGDYMGFSDDLRRRFDLPKIARDPKRTRISRRLLS